jgi:molybdopterin synthase catalytic subunit
MHVEVYFRSEPIPRPFPFAAHGRNAGALVEFYGTVRGSEADQPIGGLRYEAYQPMAELHIRRILDELNALNRCEAAIVVHRIGEVSVGEAAIYVGISSIHRQEGFQLLTDFMNRFKKDVPIWKTEVLPC